VNLSRQLTQPASLEQALASAAIVFQFRNEPSQTLAYAEEALAISREQGFTYRAALDSILLGWAKAALGERHEGATLLVQGLAASRATGADSWTDYYLGLLAKAHVMASHIKEAWDAVTEALAIVHARGGSYYAAELHRIRGELLLMQAEPQEAEHSFLQAIAVAQRQNAKSLELRATTNLSRLRQKQGEVGK